MRYVIKKKEVIFTPAEMIAELNLLITPSRFGRLLNSNIKRLEKEVENALIENGIQYIWQTNYKTFSWLKKQSLDFYLPDYNIAIECQGGQHFEPCEYFGGEKQFKKQIERDKNKKELCKLKGINLIYFTHEKNTPYQCVNTIEDLIKKIRELK